MRSKILTINRKKKKYPSNLSLFYVPFRNCTDQMQILLIEKLLKILPPKCEIDVLRNQTIARSSQGVDQFVSRRYLYHDVCTIFQIR